MGEGTKLENKQHMILTDNTTTLMGVRKKGNPDICNNVDGSERHYAKWDFIMLRLRKTNAIQSHLYVESKKF